MPHAELPFDRTNISPGSRVAVAISGGADSVALLCILHAANKLRREPLGVGLAAIHVHHGLRGEQADEDAAFVQQLCLQLEVPLQIHHADVPAYRRSTGGGLEEAARTLRYRAFHDLLSSGAADSLMTAHTLDDQAETVLMKFLRGAWTEGLGGIHPLVLPAQAPGKRIVRPLLGTSRAEVLGYLQAIGQPWREDASNTDPSHTRNRLRHHLLPLLRQENPSLDSTLAHLAELAREEEARWQVELGRLLPRLLLPGKPVRGGGRAVSTASGTATVAIEIDHLRSLDNPTRRRVLRAAVRSLEIPGEEAARLNFDETGRLLALCGFRHEPTIRAQAGTVLHLAQDLRAERSVRELRIERAPDILSQKKPRER